MASVNHSSTAAIPILLASCESGPLVGSLHLMQAKQVYSVTTGLMVAEVRESHGPSCRLKQ
jgi:hypothetical protein